MLVNTIPFRSRGERGAKVKQSIDYLIDRSTNGWLCFLGGSAKKAHSFGDVRARDGFKQAARGRGEASQG